MSNDFDFNDAEEQFDPFALIPDGTLANLTLVLCSETSDGLTQSKMSNAKYLKCELTVVGGKFNNKKFFQNFCLSGGKTDSSGNSIAGNISRSTLRAILESSRNIKAGDVSANAIKARQIKNYFNFDGMNFVAKIGIQKAEKETDYSDQNKIKKVITPDMEEYNIIKSGQAMPTKKTTPQKTKVRDAFSWTGSEPETPNDESQDTPPFVSDNNIPEWAK